MISRAAESKAVHYQPVPRVIKRCRFCQEEFIGTQRSVYCSRRCCQRYSEKHRKPRARHRESRWHLKPVRGPFVCLYCGIEYTTQRAEGEGEKFCSRECSFAHLHEIAKNIPFSRVYPGYCLSCKSYFVARYEHQKFCSKSCRRKYELLKLAHSRDPRECAVCHVQYCLIPGLKGMRYCSRKCWRRSPSARVYKLRKQIEHRTISDRYFRKTKIESFDPFEIFDRDGWHCRMCGCHTPSSKRGSCNDDAPELDHVMPLSKGGDHTRDNTMLLCRRCNQEKGDRVLNHSFYITLGHM